MSHNTNSKEIEIIWFKRGLRVEDNPLLHFAEGNVLPIFIFDTDILKKFRGDDSRLTFLYNTVIKLKNRLKKSGLDLLILKGSPIEVFEYLGSLFKIIKIHTSKDYDSYSKKINSIIEKRFTLNLVSDAFIFGPEEIKTKSGGIYKIYTPFKNHCFAILEEKSKKFFKPNNRVGLVKYDYNNLISFENGKKESLPLTIENIGIQDIKIKYLWAEFPSEKLLKRLETIVHNYARYRDFPSIDGTSHLSCALKYGTVSIREILRRITNIKNSRVFIEELLWREFFYYLFNHFPETQKENFRNIKLFWKDNAYLYEKWKNGETGIPIVDAGMRQLNEEGFMHNRVRMIVASFLTKNLHTDWRLGEKYFADTLFDYELSSNIGNWQWVSGTGADPKSLYRIFNPFIQAQRFDPEAVYIKRYVPELKHLSPSQINNKEFIYQNRIKNYPPPIVDIKLAALEFKMLIRKF